MRKVDHYWIGTEYGIRFWKKKYSSRFHDPLIHKSISEHVGISDNDTETATEEEGKRCSWYTWYANNIEVSALQRNMYLR